MSGVPKPLRRIYLAARSARRHELIGYAQELEEDGFQIVCRWLRAPAGWPASGAALEAAIADLEDLESADVCVAFSEPDEQPARGRGGRHVELGFALGREIPVLLVGPREHVFHHLPSVHQLDDWSEARAQLQRWAAST